MEIEEEISKQHKRTFFLKKNEYLNHESFDGFKRLLILGGLNGENTVHVFIHTFKTYHNI